jgi:hypothetical protein
MPERPGDRTTAEATFGSASPNVAFAFIAVPAGRGLRSDADASSRASLSSRRKATFIGPPVSTPYFRQRAESRSTASMCCLAKTFPRVPYQPKARIARRGTSTRGACGSCSTAEASLPEAAVCLGEWTCSGLQRRNASYLIYLQTNMLCCYLIDVSRFPENDLC